MTLHVFSPEHDMALAYDSKYFMVPHTGRQLRNDLDYLPVLWAEEGDYVLVENVSSAQQYASRLQRYGKQVDFVDEKSVDCLLEQIDKVVPWGWDPSIKFQLGQMGIKSSVLPDNEVPANVRRLSNRQFPPVILKELQESFAHPILFGESSYVDSLVELEIILQSLSKAVIKAPWSSSRGGVRHVDTVLDVTLANRSKNVTKTQGGIMIEPYYNKVEDFGVEFHANENGVHYTGLFAFHAINGAYVGNSLADRAEKHPTLFTYISNELLHEAISSLEQLLTNHLRGVYSGPLGVDTMIVAAENSFTLHPVVEVNSRHMVGHVALSLSTWKEFHNRMMRIDYDGSRYHLYIVHKDR